MPQVLHRVVDILLLCKQKGNFSNPALLRVLSSTSALPLWFQPIWSRHAPVPSRFATNGKTSNVHGFVLVVWFYTELLYCIGPIPTIRPFYGVSTLQLIQQLFYITTTMPEGPVIFHVESEEEFPQVCIPRCVSCFCCSWGMWCVIHMRSWVYTSANTAFWCQIAVTRSSTSSQVLQHENVSYLDIPV